MKASSEMKITAPVAVASRTFSRHKQLRELMLSKFSNVVFNDEGLSLSGAALRNFMKRKAGAIVALEPITAEIIDALPELRAIAKYGVGLDNIDQEALKRRGIKLGWTGGVNARGVSELALAFMLGLLRNVFLTSRHLAAGQWKNDGGMQLSEKAVGVIGCGHIGKDIIKLLQPFGCRILVHDILDMTAFCQTVGARQVTKEELLRGSDIVTLHIPFGEETRGYIGHKELAMMKPEAILVNTSRGNIVDESALLTALKENKIAGAGMDVFSIEPPGDCPLFSLPNFTGTPHIGGSSREAILAMGKAAIENLEKLLG
jgi:phosphoglycerate dehydrogenase-like enzyme